ncbi:MAG: sce7726 family protein [Sphaerochaeta sp.]
MNDNNYDLNKIFTKQVLNNLLKNKNTNLYHSITHQYLSDYENYYNKDIFNKIYEYLSKYYRNEYFYQNTLINKLLLGKHSVNTTTALTQLPIDQAKADFILINGKAVVYEIKTELDSFIRLENQLNNYYKAFDHVCVVTSPDKYNKLTTFLSNYNVGIYILSKQNRLQEKRKPQKFNKYINHSSLFKILRKNEFENILLDYYNKLPSEKPVFYYEECYKEFKKIPLDFAYNEFLRELKKRSIKLNKEEFKKVPYELKSMVYFSEQSNKQYEQLNKFLNTKYQEVD